MLAIWLNQDEFNEDYLVDTVVYRGGLNYFLGGKEDNKSIK